IDGVQEVEAAEAIGDPFALFPRVVEVKHGSDRIDAKPIDVIFVEPEEAIRDEEIAHLVSAVIEDERAPVTMFALARISVRVKLGSIEQSQTVRVLREMPGYPVNDDADIVFVATIDKMAEFVRVAE